MDLPPLQTRPLTAPPPTATPGARVRPGVELAGPPAVRGGAPSLTSRAVVAYPVAFAAMAFAGWLDVVVAGRVEHDVLLLGLYLVPVGYLAYAQGALAGLLLSAVAAGTLVFANGLEGRAAAWNAGLMFATAAGAAWALARLRADRVRILRLLESERRLARLDPLTGVASRSAFYERLALELERMDRHGRPLSLLFLDLDDFKQVNDARGHPEGDRVLARVGGALASVVRKIDLCARLGGDEFAVLMPETGVEDGAAAVRRVREALDSVFESETPRIGASAGLGTFESVPGTAEDPVGLVDRLMYEAKRCGKNQLVQRVFP